MSKNSNTQELKENKIPEQLDQKQQTEKGSVQELQAQIPNSQGQRMFAMHSVGNQGEKQDQGQEKRQGILEKIWNVLEQIPIIGLLFKAIGAIFRALFGGGQSRDNNNLQQSRSQQSPQIVIMQELVPMHEQETGRGESTRVLEQEGQNKGDREKSSEVIRDPNREGVAATERKGPEVAQNNLKGILDREEIASVAEGLKDMKPDIGDRSIVARPEQTPAQQDIGNSQGKRICS